MIGATTRPLGAHAELLFDLGRVEHADGEPDAASPEPAGLCGQEEILHREPAVRVCIGVGRVDADDDESAGVVEDVEIRVGHEGRITFDLRVCLGSCEQHLLGPIGVAAQACGVLDHREAPYLAVHRARRLDGHLEERADGHLLDRRWLVLAHRAAAVDRLGEATSSALTIVARAKITASLQAARGRGCGRGWRGIAQSARGRSGPCNNV